jgi:hypothetical protein
MSDPCTVELGSGVTLHVSSVSYETANRKRLNFEGTIPGGSRMFLRQQTTQIFVSYSSDPRHDPHGYGKRRAWLLSPWDNFTPKAWAKINGLMQAHFLAHGIGEIIESKFRCGQANEAQTYVALKTKYELIIAYVKECERLADGLAANLFEIRPVPEVTVQFRVPRLALPHDPDRSEQATAAVWDGQTQVGWLLETNNLAVPMHDHTTRKTS